MPVMQALQRRAPVFLRVNAAKASVAQAQAALARDGIATQPHPLASLALEVTENARKVQGAAAYAQGLVELQDAASQAVAQAVPLRDGQRVLDLCAGGGGKALALAAQARVQMSPMMRKLACRCAQQCPMFGHAASSHTVCSLPFLTVSIVSANTAPAGAGTRIQSGFGPPEVSDLRRFSGWRRAGSVGAGMGLETSVSPAKKPDAYPRCWSSPLPRRDCKTEVALSI